MNEHQGPHSEESIPPEPSAPATITGEVIKFHCSQCKQKISAEPDQAGQNVQCPACGAELTVPQSSHTPDMEEKPSSGGSEAPPQPPAVQEAPPKTHYVIKNGNQSGPYSVGEITTKVTAGEFSANDLCWAQGMADWESIAKTLSLGAVAPPPPPPGLSVSSKPKSPGVLDASKNLSGSLVALGGALCQSIKAAATSESAQQATQKVVETSSKLRTRAAEMASTAANSEVLRAAADTINKGADEIQKKASSLAHHGQQAAPAPEQEGPPNGPPAPPASIEVAGSNTRRINWIVALAFFCLSAAFIVIVNLATMDGNEAEAAMIALVGLPIMILAVIFTSLLHHKCWKTLPPSFRATTPGKAVGFMFIPFYNFYWGFISLPKLPEGLANWQKSVGVNPTNTSGLGTTLAILFICYSVMAMLSIHLLVVLLAVAALVIFIIYYKKVVSGLNQMVAASTVEPAPVLAGFWNFKRTAISMAVVLPIYWLILGITYDPASTPRNYSSGGYGSEEQYNPGWNTNQRRWSEIEMQPCSACGGSGQGTSRSPLLSCGTCKGKRTIRAGSGFEIVCPDCSGTGKKMSSCSVCNGKGQVMK